jgi:hypothetical protein
LTFFSRFSFSTTVTETLFDSTPFSVALKVVAPFVRGFISALSIVIIELSTISKVTSDEMSLEELSL